MKKYLSEFIGTFALVFFGTGAIVINSEFEGVVSHPGIALTFGLIVSTMIYALGGISGAHFNPAVTLGFWLSGLFPRKEILPFVISQIFAGLAASLTLRLLFPSAEFLGATTPAGTAWQSFVLEIILSFFLMLVILQVSTEGKEKGMFAGIAVGSIVMLEALIAGPVSGASMNPARSFGPAIISGETKGLWIYLSAPVFGSAISVFCWKILKKDEN